MKPCCTGSTMPASSTSPASSSAPPTSGSKKRGATTQVRAPWTEAGRVPGCTPCRTRTDCLSSSASRRVTPTAPKD
jgi:hypothetical protein